IVEEAAENAAEAVDSSLRCKFFYNTHGRNYTSTGKRSGVYARAKTLKTYCGLSAGVNNTVHQAD
ncbi:MAG TPA: hypothetical protein VIF86_01520, partial [Methylobacter sp.]